MSQMTNKKSLVKPGSFLCPDFSSEESESYSLASMQDKIKDIILGLMSHMWLKTDTLHQGTFWIASVQVFYGKISISEALQG